MPKIKAYVDTSILGAIYDTEDPIRVNITKQLLNLFQKQENFIPFISNIVIEEVEKPQKTSLPV